MNGLTTYRVDTRSRISYKKPVQDDMYRLKVKVKADIALPRGTPPQSYGMSLAIWDHTVLPATRHKLTRPA